jgi:hypothetical protein
MKTPEVVRLVVGEGRDLGADRGPELVGGDPLSVGEVLVIEGGFSLGVIIEVVVQLGLRPTLQAPERDDGMLVRHRLMPEPVHHGDAIGRLDVIRQAETVVMVPRGAVVEHTSGQPTGRVVRGHLRVLEGAHVVGVGFPEEPGGFPIEEPPADGIVLDPVHTLQGVGELMAGDQAVLHRPRMHPHRPDGVVIGAAKSPSRRLPRHAPRVVHHDDALVLAQVLGRGVGDELDVGHELGVRLLQGVADRDGIEGERGVGIGDGVVPHHGAPETDEVVALIGPRHGIQLERGVGGELRGDEDGLGGGQRRAQADEEKENGPQDLDESLSPHADLARWINRFQIPLLKTPWMVTSARGRTAEDVKTFRQQGDANELKRLLQGEMGEKPRPSPRKHCFNDVALKKVLQATRWKPRKIHRPLTLDPILVQRSPGAD